MIAFEGNTLRAAEWRMDAHMRAVVILMIGVGPNSDPVQVSRLFGEKPEHIAAAANWARSIPARALVRAAGRNLVHITDHGERRFGLRDLVELYIDGEAVPL